MFGVLIAGGVAAAVVVASERFYYVVIAILAAVVLPFSLLTLRRIERNVALLSEGPNA